MIPAILAAQFAKPLVKWGTIIGGIALLLVIYGVWCYSKGKAATQQKWDAAIMQQAQESALQVIAEAKMSNEVLKDHATAERLVETKLKVIEKEVIRYVTTTTNVCPMDAEFVRLYDDLRRVLDAGEDGLSAADASAGEFTESATTNVTAAEVLTALTDFVAQVKQSILTYQALAQWERGRYTIQRTQHEQTP